MFWFALVPGFALCVLVFGLILCEWLQMAAGSEESNDVACPVCGSFKQHLFADDHD